MNVLMEQIYNVIEAFLLTWFVFSYFGNKKSSCAVINYLVSFTILFLNANAMSYLKVSWLLNFILLNLILMLLMQCFCEGTFMEHTIMAIISVDLLALTSIYSLTLICKALNADFETLTRQNDLYRFSAVVINKTIFLALLSIILMVRKKYVFMLHKNEYILLITTLVASFVPIVLVRGIVLDSQKYYGFFLALLLCILVINIIQIVTIIYISKKNINEQNISVMKKQIEMQGQNICDLEDKYEQTSQLRHDMKNHISCALTMAEQTDHNSLISYLKELNESYIAPSDSYIKTERKTLNAVINTKIEEAKRRHFDVQCVILDELQNISDIDVGIMLSNLLDNAIEACEQNSAASLIELKIWSEAGYYCIDLSNTVEFDVLSVNPSLGTNKKEKSVHGLGLKSVRSIVDKYQGMINFCQKSDSFHVYVSLCRYLQ